MATNRGITSIDNADVFRGVLVVASATVLGILIITQGMSDIRNSTRAAANASSGLEFEGQSYFEDLKSPSTSLDNKVEAVLSEPVESTVVETPPTTDKALKSKSELRVGVFNAAGIQGVAQEVTEKVRALEYITLFPNNSLQNVDISSVLYVDGYFAEASLLAEELGLSLTSVQLLDDNNRPVNNIGEANILVIVGEDKVLL